MLSLFKSIATYVGSKILTAYNSIKTILGYNTRDASSGTISLDGEIYDPSKPEDETILEERVFELSQTVIDTCSVIFLIIVSCLIVSEFSWLLLIITEVAAVYFFISRLLGSLFKKEEDLQV